ncbi:unnamed protein product [Dovyalis caffra]|uniref:Uncharacterized protein n=1 Tax=Dovyalis caffra TaxID=77055 RepID=A0AAV1S1W2_9ROSI|nr:unnamed protein product [Dovyalis caffra]
MRSLSEREKRCRFRLTERVSGEERIERKCCRLSLGGDEAKFGAAVMVSKVKFDHIFTLDHGTP